ncbi:MAG: sugar phosphate nucleotidyltransferase [Nitrospira sp.]|nr:sugar phosphate nucleotidyltransferase [Nitrospira sp.]
MNVDITDPPDLLVLCGGQGTRLRSILRGQPKPLAMMGKRPFIEFAIAPFVWQGVRRVILCTGHLGHQFEKWGANHTCTYDLIFSREPMPLGTAGAIRHASQLITSSTVVVANGDSVCGIDLHRLLACHAEKKARATMALTNSDGRRDVGMVVMDAQHRITAFCEKGGDRSVGFHNAGIYVFERSVLELIPARQPCSLELEWLPTLIPTGIYGFVSQGPLYDIGTPERLAEFQTLVCSKAASQGIPSSIRFVACA